MKIKKIAISIIILFLLSAAYCLFFLPNEASAQYQLEIDYPVLPSGGGDPATGLVGYLRYLYTFGLAAVGIAGLGALVYGGLMYMLSGTITSKEEAKKQIWGAIAGLVLALSAYLILNTINPDLVKFKLPQTGSQIEKVEKLAKLNCSNFI